jgi:hypothetical protein
MGLSKAQYQKNQPIGAHPSHPTPQTSPRTGEKAHLAKTVFNSQQPFRQIRLIPSSLFRFPRPLPGQALRKMQPPKRTSRRNCTSAGEHSATWRNPPRGRSTHRRTAHYPTASLSEDPLIARPRWTGVLPHTALDGGTRLRQKCAEAREGPRRKSFLIE